MHGARPAGARLQAQLQYETLAKYSPKRERVRKLPLWPGGNRFCYWYAKWMRSAFGECGLLRHELRDKALAFRNTFNLDGNRVNRLFHALHSQIGFARHWSRGCT